MTKMDTIAQIQAHLAELTDEQLQALVELTDGWRRSSPPEDAATRAAVSEGLAQAQRGEFVSRGDVEQLLTHPWK